MNTVGKIFNAGLNNFDDFTTKMFDQNGDPPQLSSDGAYMDPNEHLYEILPDVKHSFSAFLIAADFDIQGENYTADIGLSARQIKWPVNMYFSVTRQGDGTRVSLGDPRTGNFRFVETLPLILEGLVKMRVTYSNLQWDLSVIYKGASYDYSYRYQRPAVNGHVTSVFAFNCEGADMYLKKLVVDVPVLKGLPLFVGDSIMWGAGRVFGTRTFAEQFIANDGRANIFASGSANSTDIINCYKAIELLAPSDIFLLIGDNDDYNTPSIFQSNIETILDDWMNTLPANGVPVPTIALMNLTPENGNPGYAALRDVINGIALPSPHRKIDSWSSLASADNPDLADPVNTVDGVHLSPVANNKLYALL